MRLVTPTLWRAFPELDEFSDDLCRKFVAAATSRWRSQCLRFTLVGLVACATVGAGVLAHAGLTTFADTHTHWRDLPDWTVALLQAAALSLTLLVGFCIGLVVRDQVLRRQVRRVIRRRGVCARCGYSLLGMRVGSDLKVICPECGAGTVVDPAIGELARDPDGAAGVYNPVAPTMDPERSRRRWRLIRTIAVWGVRVLLVLTLITAGTAAWIWRGLHLDSEKASRLIAEGGGSIATAEAAASAAEQRWARPVRDAGDVMRVINAYRLDEGRVRGLMWTEADLASTSGNLTPPEFWRIYMPADELARTFAGRTPAEVETERLKMMQTVRRVSETPGAKGLEALPELLPCVPTSSGAGLWVNNPVFWGLNHAGQFCLAQAAVAREEADRRAFVGALDRTLAACDMLLSGPRMYMVSAGDRYRRYAAHHALLAIVDPTKADWRADIQAVLAKYARTPTLGDAVRGDCAALRLYIAGVYADPVQTLKSRFSRTNPMGPTFPRDPTFDRTIDETLAELKEQEDMIAAFADRPASERSYVPAPVIPAPGAGATASLPWMLNVIQHHDYSEARFRGAIVIAGVQAYRERTGEWPDTLSLLTTADLGVDPASVLDPFSGKPFGYRRVDAATDLHHRPFILYSTGPDGTDDGGALPVAPNQMEQGITPATGSDIILNPNVKLPPPEAGAN